MFKIWIDSKLRKESTVKLFKKTFLFWSEIDEVKTADPVDAIQQILNKNNLGIKDIQNFSTFRGPGSYTGLKIGHAVANTLEWALNNKRVEELPLPKYGSEPHITPPKTVH